MEYDVAQGLVLAISRIEEKLDKHDDKFDMIATTLQTLVKIDTETKELRESIKRLFKRVDDIENIQHNGGCTTLKSFRSEYDNELKHNLEKIKSCEEFKDKIEAKFNELEMKPAKRVDGMITHGLSAFVGALVLYIMSKIGLSK